MASSRKEKHDALIKDLHDAVAKKDVDRLRQLLPVDDPDLARSLCEAEVKPYGSLLHHAAGVGDSGVLLTILDAGVDVNLRQTESDVTENQTALHVAALAGSGELVEALLSRGADVGAVESEGLTPLHCACSGNDVRTVERLLAAGAKVNVPDHSGQYPIQRSVLRSSNEITRILIANGADTHVTDGFRQTLLHYAVEWDDAELVRTFLDAGISPNAQDAKGRSPLHLAESDAVRQILIERGADPELRDDGGKPAVEKKLDKEQDDYKRIKELFEKQLSVVETSEPGADDS